MCPNNTSWPLKFEFCKIFMYKILAFPGCSSAMKRNVKNSAQLVGRVKTGSEPDLFVGHGSPAPQPQVPESSSKYRASVE